MSRGRRAVGPHEAKDLALRTISRLKTGYVRVAGGGRLIGWGETYTGVWRNVSEAPGFRAPGGGSLLSIAVTEVER